MLYMFVIRDVFCPQVTLYSLYEFLFIFVQLVERIETVAGAKRKMTANGKRLAIGLVILGLIIIQIEIRRRSHNDVIAQFRSFNTSFCTSPGHHCSGFGDSALQYLVPAYDFASFAVEIILYSAYEIALEFLFILETVVFDALLAGRTFFPFGFACFVSSYVYVFAWEDAAHFVKHVLQELESLFPSGAEQICVDSPSGPYLVVVVFAKTSQPRITCEGRLRVSGHLYFRDDRYATLCGIFDYLLGFFLRVITSVRDAVIAYVGVERSYEGFLAYGTGFREFGIFLYLQSPALVVRKVPVEGVYLVKCKNVDIILDLLNIEEMPAYIQMRSSIRECRIVFYVHSADT